MNGLLNGLNVETLLGLQEEHWSSEDDKVLGVYASSKDALEAAKRALEAGSVTLGTLPDVDYVYQVANDQQQAIYGLHEVKSSNEAGPHALHLQLTAGTGPLVVLYQDDLLAGGLQVALVSQRRAGGKTSVYGVHNHVGSGDLYRWIAASFDGTLPKLASTQISVTVPVKAMQKLQQAWAIKSEQMSILLGYETADEWAAVESGSIQLDGSIDRKDRIGMLIRIHQLLWGLFRDDRAVQNWLRATSDAFAGAPLDFMLRGKIKNLYAVADYIYGLTDHSFTGA